MVQELKAELDECELLRLRHLCTPTDLPTSKYRAYFPSSSPELVSRIIPRCSEAHSLTSRTLHAFAGRSPAPAPKLPSPPADNSELSSTPYNSRSSAPSSSPSSKPGIPRSRISPSAFKSTCSRFGPGRRSWRSWWRWDRLTGAFIGSPSTLVSHFPASGAGWTCLLTSPLGFPCLVALHTLRGQLIGGRYLFRVAESLQTSIRALQLLKDSSVSSLSCRATSLATDSFHPHSTPEADWTFQSCKKLASYVNGWRPSDGFDYETFLLSPSTAPAELYLSLPPFASTSEDTQVVSLHPDVSYAISLNLRSPISLLTSSRFCSTDQLAFSQPIESSFLDISTTQLDIFASFLAEDSSLFSQETLGFSHALAEGGAKWPEDWAWREWQGR